MSRIEATYTGPEAVTWGDETWTGANAEGDLARWLIGQGHDPATPMVVCRDGVVALRGTIHAFARRAWQGAGTDPAFGKWRPHPQGNYPDALGRWHARTASQDQGATPTAGKREKPLAVPPTLSSETGTEPGP